MTSTDVPVFVPGVWGPYFSAMVPGMWLNEGGQSAAGSAIDHLLAFHPAAAAAKAEAAGVPLPVFIAYAAASMASAPSDVVGLAKGLHVVPEFLGNRAPFADPHARAVIAGLGMEQDFQNLVALYVAGLCGIGYGLRQIMEAQAKSGADVERVVISGGAGQHHLVRQIIADSCGKQVVATASEEPVLLGSAILGAVASGAFSDTASAMRGMSRADKTYDPATGQVADVHRLRYQSFQMLQEQARSLVMH